MHGGLDADHLSTPTPASGTAQHPASVFRRASARQPLTVSRTMEATRGQIKTISSAAKHSLLTSHRSPASRLSASPDVKSSPPVRSKPPTNTGRQPSVAAKPQTTAADGPAVQVKPMKPANTDVASPAQSPAQEVRDERLDSVTEDKATPTKAERTPTKAATPSAPVTSAAATPRSKTRKAVEGVEIRSETRQAIVSPR